MINILEILKKIPNLEDMVFYSPLYGDIRVHLSFIETSHMIAVHPIKNDIGRCSYLDKYGRFFESGEILLYPSKENRDWFTFKIPRKDLIEGTSVMVSRNKKSWELRKYDRNSYCYEATSVCKDTWEYIVPVDKFNFNTWTFKEEDNYGTDDN